jgi:cytochrome c oxidase subunit IV
MSDEHNTHHVNYLLIFITLCGCTLLSIIFDVVEISNKGVLITLVLGVAVAKALFVMLFFMHLKFEGNWKFVLLAPTTILAIGLPLALLPDIGVHYYTVASPQEKEIRQTLRKIVAKEDKANPNTDEELAAKLKEHHIRLNLQTIAQFRSSMNIPSAEERRTE